MTAVDGRLWVAGERGVSRRELDGNWTRIAAGHFDRGDRLLAIALGEPGADGRRAVWIGGERSLDRMPDPEGVPERFMSGSRVSSIQPVAGGAWVATDRGLMFADDAGALGPAADVPAFPAGAVTGDGKRVWAGVDRDVWQREEGGGWRRLDAIGALSSPVTSLAWAGGVLWIGTADELMSWEVDGRGPRRRYTFAAGDLPLGPFGERGISDILPSGRSRVWIATPAGALRLDSPF
jgi:ligand-binding sensor domain-containing protein